MKGIRFKVNFTFLFLLLVLGTIGDVSARRFSSGSKTSKSSYRSSSSSSSTSSNRRTNNYGNHGSSSGHTGTSHTGTSYPGASHTGTSYPGASHTNTNYNQGRPQTSNSKDASNTFLHAERTPVTSSPPRTPSETSHTAAPTWSSNHRYVPRPGGRAGNSSSPHAPSAPPMQDVYKSPSSGHSSHPTYGRANATVSQTAPIGFNQGYQSTSRPLYGSNPSPSYGWNVNQQPPTSSVGNPYGHVQSGNPYGQPQSGNPYGNPHIGNPYSSGHVPVGNPYSSGHAPVGTPYSFGHAPVGNPYSSGHVPYGSPYSSGHVPTGNSYPHGGGTAYGSSPYPQQQQFVSQPAYQPFVPGQTIMMVPQQQESGRGIGQIFKEALVFSAVHATVNRLINPPQYYGSQSKPQTTENTYIIHNNQYITNGNNGSTNTMHENVPSGGNQGNPSVPYNPSSGIAGKPTSFGNGNGNVNVNAAGSNTNTPNQGNTTTNTQQPPANVPPIQYAISDDELFKITEKLFEKNTLNLLKYITLNLQNRSTSVNITDDAKEPLFNVDPIVYDYPTISVTRALYKNYEHDSRKPEDLNLEKYKEENLFLDIILDTNTMSTAMQWLVDHGFIYPDDFAKKELLQRLWFTVFQRSSCGFERAFMSENYAGVGLVGAQNWLYFSHEEFQKHIDYMGYVDKVNLGSTASLLKLNLQMAGVVRPNVTVFVGTLPELEMALYTICYYARPNNACPVSLGGTKFNIFTHSFSYFGTDVIDIVVPFF